MEGSVTAKEGPPPETVQERGGEGCTLACASHNQALPLAAYPSSNFSLLACRHLRLPRLSRFSSHLLLPEGSRLERWPRYEHQITHRYPVNLCVEFSYVIDDPSPAAFARVYLADDGAGFDQTLPQPRNRDREGLPFPKIYEGIFRWGGQGEKRYPPD